MPTGLQIAILGTIEARLDEDVVAVPAGKQRALLALLALRAPHPVSAEFAADGLWPRAAPPEAMRNLQVTVSRLRRSLGAAGSALETVASGYRLMLEADAIDARRFEALIESARATRLEGDGAHARRLLDDALGLWRGAALADVAFASFAQTEIARLEELRLAAMEERIDARLSAGEHSLAVAELEQLAAEHPWRERLHAQLMIALYRSHRQADALEAFRHAREVLVEQLGIEPGAELHDLHRAILVQDPAIAAPAPEPRSPRAGVVPAPPNRTVGRARELAAIGERLLNPSVRLLTLTGPGGVGKTRLALEAARSVSADFADGAHLVSLDAVQQSGDVAAAIVRSLGIILLADESDHEAVARFLAAKHLLLVADNFEHVLAAAPFVGELLVGCPGLTVLATSREPLELQVEQRHAVPPLALPEVGMSDDAPSIGAVASVELFEVRARAHDPAFDLDEENVAAVAEICRRVDGLPLAIELAAARCGLMSPSEIAQRLDRALGALGTGPRDAPARQRTLRATVNWSHKMLSDEERVVFARFAVFAGGASVEAAEAITGADLDMLDRLVAKSLLVRRRSPRGPTRLAMLETVRAYAAECLATATDRQEVRRRHYRYYLALADRHATERALWGIHHRQHLATLDADSENLDRALRWAVDEGAEPSLRLCAALGTYWLIRCRNAHVLEWTDRVLGLANVDAHPAARVRVLCTKAWCLFPLGLGREQPAVTVEAESTATALQDPVLLSRVLQIRSIHESAHLDRPDVADELAVTALRWASIAKDNWTIAIAAYARALAAEDPAEVRAQVDKAAVLLEQVGNVYLGADMLASVAYTALTYEGYDDARDFIGRAIVAAKDLDYPHLQMLLCGNLAVTLLLTGEIDAARRAFRDELQRCRELVILPWAFDGFQGLAAIAAAHENDPERAARLAGAATAHSYGSPMDAVDAKVEAVFIEPARSRSDADAWSVAFQQGAALSFEKAIAYALQETGA